METLNITYIGHSTLLLDWGSLHILTDPLFTDRLWFMRRILPVGVPPEGLPYIDFVLLSHLHPDHLHLPSLNLCDEETVVLCPKGAGPKISPKITSQDHDLDTWQEFVYGGLKVTAVPAQHFAFTHPFNRVKFPVCGFVVATEAGTVYFAGDTGFNAAMFRSIKERCGPIDVALLPIFGVGPYPWAVNPRLLNHRDALEATDLLEARFLIPIHWGAFAFPRSRYRHPNQLLQTVGGTALDSRVLILEPGQGFRFVRTLDSSPV